VPQVRIAYCLRQAGRGGAFDLLVPALPAAVERRPPAHAASPPGVTVVPCFTSARHFHASQIAT